MNLNELQEQFKKTTFYNDRDFSWDNTQGNYFGKTLICLADTYEGSDEDIKFLRELVQWIAAKNQNRGEAEAKKL